MKKELLAYSKAPHFIINDIHGPLTIRVSPEKAITLKGHDFNIDEGEEGSDIYKISGQADLSLWAPLESIFEINEVHGPLVINGIQGEITINTCHGHLSLRNTGSATVQTVHGPLKARDLSGTVSVQTINGDGMLRNLHSVQIDHINGDLVIKNIVEDVTISKARGDVSLNTIGRNVTLSHGGRDVNLRNISGQLTVSAVDGDIRLYDSLITGNHSLNANGDVIIRWPVSAPLNVTVKANGDIRYRLPFETVVANEEEHPRSFVGSYGDGKTNLSIESKGDVIMKSITNVKVDSDHFKGDIDIDFDSFNDFGNQMADFGERIANQMASLSQEFESRFDSDYAEKIARKAEEAAAKVSNKIAEAMRRAELQIAAAEVAQVTRDRDRQRVRDAAQPHAPVPPAPPVDTSAAQLKVLEMLEKGTITVEEANTLLKALE